ncbi:hypothetical protein [Vagococcus acidifermentans]|nr:hypothetical protein [Vagococcus acidifermentans]
MESDPIEYLAKTIEERKWDYHYADSWEQAELEKLKKDRTNDEI